MIWKWPEQESKRFKGLPDWHLIERRQETQSWKLWRKCGRFPWQSPTPAAPPDRVPARCCRPPSWFRSPRLYGGTHVKRWEWGTPPCGLWCRFCSWSGCVTELAVGSELRFKKIVAELPLVLHVISQVEFPLLLFAPHFSDHKLQLFLVLLFSSLLCSVLFSFHNGTIANVLRFNFFERKENVKTFYKFISEKKIKDKNELNVWDNFQIFVYTLRLFFKYFHKLILIYGKIIYFNLCLFRFTLVQLGSIQFSSTEFGLF